MSQTEYTLPATEAAGAHRAAQAFARSGIPASLRYYVAGFVHATECAYRRLLDGEQALVEECAARDEAGAYVPCKDKDGNEVPNSFEFTSPEAGARFRAEMAELHATPVTITYTPIPMARYFERLDAEGYNPPEGVLETLWPFFEHEAAA